MYDQSTNTTTQLDVSRQSSSAQSSSSSQQPDVTRQPVSSQPSSSMAAVNAVLKRFNESPASKTGMTCLLIRTVSIWETVQSVSWPYQYGNFYKNIRKFSCNRAVTVSCHNRIIWKPLYCFSSSEDQYGASWGKGLMFLSIPLLGECTLFPAVMELARNLVLPPSSHVSHSSIGYGDISNITWLVNI